MESYFPLIEGKYITLQNGSGMQSKNYSLYQDVVDFIQPSLKQAGYSIVQIGDEGDAPIEGCLHLQGKTNLNQAAYVLKNSSLHIGNDSFPVHFCSGYDVPVVSLYSVITPASSGSYWKTSPQVNIMAPLKGKPSYSNEENPKTINLIYPEKLIKEIYSILGIEFNSGMPDTIFFGENYPNYTRDLVPDGPFLVNHINKPLNIRFDFLSERVTSENLHFAAQNIQNGKCVLIASAPFDLTPLLPLKNNIVALLYSFDREKTPIATESITFLEFCQSNGVKVQPCLVKNRFSEKEINDLKLDYLDFGRITCLNETKWDDAIKEKINNNSVFKSSRLIYSKNKVYLSKTAYLNDAPVTARTQKILEIPNWEELGAELEYCYIYNTKR